MSPENRVITTADIEVWIGVALVFAAIVSGAAWPVLGTIAMWVDACNDGKVANRVIANFLPKD